MDNTASMLLQPQEILAVEEKTSVTTAVDSTPEQLALNKDTLNDSTVHESMGSSLNKHDKIVDSPAAEAMKDSPITSNIFRTILNIGYEYSKNLKKYRTLCCRFSLQSFFPTPKTVSPTHVGFPPAII